MQRWGTTTSGRLRFRCPQCRRSASVQRPDNRARRDQADFVGWLIQRQLQTTLARQRGIGVRALRARFRFHWTPLPPMPSPCAGLIVDATHIASGQVVALIARDDEGRVTWAFASREDFVGWYRLLARFEVPPRWVVCDGHRDLLRVLRQIWPDVLIQRCVIHVMRQVRAHLSWHPKTDAGQRLLRLVLDLRNVKTRRQRRRWLRAWHRWLRQHDALLKERLRHPTDPRRWRYTHRKLRAARWLLHNALPNLFSYVRQPQIPRTTNLIEGGINSRLKDLLRHHRGLRPHQKITLTAHYLHHRNHP